MRPPFVALTLLALASCKSGPTTQRPGKEGPAPVARTECFFGTPLGGPTQALAASAQVGTPWTFELAAFALEGELPKGGQSLVDSVSMVVDPRRANPILPAPRYLAQSRKYGDNPEPDTGSAAAFFSDRVALLAGQTYRLVLENKDSLGLALNVQHAQGAARGYTLTLMALSNQETVEVLPLAEPWVADAGGFHLGVSLEGTRPVTVLLKLRAWAPDSKDPDLQNALAQGRAGIGLAATPRLELPSRLEPQSRFLAEAMDRLRIAPDRSVLFAMATELQARCAQDWLLICSDPAMAQFLIELGKGSGRTALTDQPDALALKFEVSALRQASAALASIESHDQALAYLIRQTGQLALYPDVLVELTELAKTTADLASRIAAENRIFLEDSSRSARLRAFEWLQTLGLEPKGYDPLSRSSQRQIALDRWREALDRAASAPQ